ncbi:hypothetical protein FHS15_002710 [Paenibacillus castaneae]|uniref:hypothetical protein n=1 Tax=Paenibacillus castaneae TaxID=474957 RepID=UPI000C9CCE1F|nr:hypothetical protein [Paenibacillus castaneae]NIK77574.1 hypothetical protein [Paenibacillus castaneae]
MTEKERIHKALAVIIRATESSSSKWIVGGSAGLLLRGVPMDAEPRDLDIYCDDEDVQSIYQALIEYAVDEPVISITGIYRSRLCHFVIENVQVELVGGFVVSALGCRYETEVRKLLMLYGEELTWAAISHPAVVVPLAHELWFNVLRGRMDRVELIINAFAEAPERHEEALRAIERNNTFTAEAKRSLSKWMGREREAGGLR